MSLRSLNRLAICSLAPMKVTPYTDVMTVWKTKDVKRFEMIQQFDECSACLEEPA